MGRVRDCTWAPPVKALFKFLRTLPSGTMMVGHRNWMPPPKQFQPTVFKSCSQLRYSHICTPRKHTLNEMKLGNLT